MSSTALWRAPLLGVFDACYGAGGASPAFVQPRSQSFGLRSACSVLVPSHYSARVPHGSSGVLSPRAHGRNNWQFVTYGWEASYLYGCTVVKVLDYLWTP